MEVFSDELMIYIFKYLSPHDLLSASEVCKKFKRITDDKILWNFKFKQNFRSINSKKYQTKLRYFKHVKLSILATYGVIYADFKPKLIARKRTLADLYELNELNDNYDTLNESSDIEWCTETDD
jgi:hypothetical protein